MAAGLLRVFVYGTLKRGGRYHDQFCHHAVAIEAAAVLGRLYELPAGYPMLVVPPEHVLAIGTSDAAADVVLQSEQQLPAETERRAVAPGSSGSWKAIQGEIATFDDPLAWLPALDYLEGFRPDARALFQRLLVMPLGGVRPVWLYAAPAGKLPRAAVEIGSSWPV